MLNATSVVSMTGALLVEDIDYPSVKMQLDEL